MFPIRIPDSRGTPVELHDPGASWRALGAMSHERKSLALIHQVTNRRTKLSKLRWALAVVTWAVFVGFLLFLIVRGVYVMAAILGMVSFGLVWDLHIGRTVQRWRHREEVARAMISHGRCASCAYELAGLTIENDGCVRCPECGANWRADRRREDADGESPRWARPFPWLTPRVRDDRGWWGRARFGRWGSLIGSRMKRRALILRTSGLIGIASYVFGWLAPAIFIAMVVIAAMGDRAILFLWALLAALLMAFLQFLLWACGSGIRAEAIRRALLDRGWCPSCDERLPAEPESDGCRVCEGCGSAWEASVPIS